LQNDDVQVEVVAKQNEMRVCCERDVERENESKQKNGFCLLLLLAPIATLLLLRCFKKGIIYTG
jgi:hypothetical protein